jgi:hypothetical protein
MYKLQTSTVMRDLVFVSHANPEDNQFCQWLSLHLAREGYPVWLDLKRLLGGENFWGDIEEAIRQRSTKFLYVLSRASNTKPGPLKELAVAQTVAKTLNLNDFVIPLRIDDLPFSEININLHQLNAISFDANWAKGFQQLLLKLEREGVKKDPNFTPSAVSEWWRTQFGAQAGVLAETEDCPSNWFEIARLPQKVYFYEGSEKRTFTGNMPTPIFYPNVEYSDRRVSFADESHFSRVFNIRRCVEFNTQDVIAGIVDERYLKQSEARKILSYLLVDNWVNMMRTREMAVYQLSNHRFCGALRQNQVKDDKVFYSALNGRPAWRGMVGYKTMKRLNGPSWVRIWHYAVQAQVRYFPELLYVVSGHVVFSEDGQAPWESRERQHNARRSQCKNWWNDDWRDRLLAMTSWLANGNEKISIDCGGDSLEVSPQPLIFHSPIKYAGIVPATPNDGDERDGAGILSDGSDELTDHDVDEGGEPCAD